MSDTTASARPPIIYQPINYLPVITEYSWWSTKSGLRKFVIVRIHWDFNEQGSWPTTIELLELQKTEPIVHPWADLVRLIEAGEMIKLT